MVVGTPKYSKRRASQTPSQTAWAVSLFLLCDIDKPLGGIILDVHSTSCPLAPSTTGTNLHHSCLLILIACLLSIRTAMAASFERPVGCHADIKELEYLSALAQTGLPSLRKDASLHGKYLLRKPKFRAPD